MLQVIDEAKPVVDGVGVFVGRFQVAELTDGHKSLFDTVISRHLKTICVVGLSPINATKNNPLDFSSRRAMIQECYPNVEVLYINDDPSDDVWSKNLDALIAKNIPPTGNVTLYGSRDSFIRFYNGRFNTKELVQESFTSGTITRKKIGFETAVSKDFRKGAIWATQRQYDTCYMAVDVCIVDGMTIDGHGSILEHGPRILLARKEKEPKYRLVGGFIDPRMQGKDGDFLESNAKREVVEETTLEVGKLHYVGSFMIDDWRYRSEVNKIASALYLTQYIFGKPVPSDDLEGGELRWFDISLFDDEKELAKHIMPEHIPLVQMATQKIKKTH
jgi:bifunctional NMN adenylyltransferase/nudix hydrolase